MLYTRVFLHRKIIWKYAKNLILMLCAQYRGLIFSSFDSYDSKLQSLSSFYFNQHSDASTMKLPYFQLILLSQLSCWFFIQIPSVFF